MDSTQHKYVLQLYVNSENPDLVQKYNGAIYKHNESIIRDSHPDSGFDLYTPTRIHMKERTMKISMDVKAAMYKYDENGRLMPCAFYMYPRSSIYKTPFRLANNVGIIDSGYRGYLGGVFDVFAPFEEEYVVCEKFNRLVQICSPTLEPFKIIAVTDDYALGQTQRGEAGFGSTGTN